MPPATIFNCSLTDVADDSGRLVEEPADRRKELGRGWRPGILPDTLVRTIKLGGVMLAVPGGLAAAAEDATAALPAVDEGMLILDTVKESPPLPPPPLLLELPPSANILADGLSPFFGASSSL